MSKEKTGIKLYRLEECPYCRRVEAKLKEKGIPFEKVDIDPYDRSDVIEISGQPSVPVMVDNGKVIAGSDKILRHLDEEY